MGGRWKVALVFFVAGWLGAHASGGAEGRLDSWTPEGKVGVSVSLCFICEDAIAVYRKAWACGLQPSEPFVGNAIWVRPLDDPDGDRSEFESFTDGPEGTRAVRVEPVAAYKKLKGRFRVPQFLTFTTG
jgi:hypothetical protein